MQPIYLKDYKDPSFSVSNTELFFEVLKDKIIVSSKLKLLKHNDDTKNLILNGEDLKTLSIALNSKVLDESQYKIADNLLEIFNVNNNDVIEIKVEINPFTNTKLMGIYKSNSCLCSQCEPEGFRRITWYIDAPNNMSLWKVSILSNDADYEYVLSNGNLIHSEVKDGKRLSVFEDPFAKPSYLFAFVAGNFDVIKDVFITKSNKKVDTAVYVEKGKANQAHFALKSLHKSMKWDEDTYNLEYDLNVFSIVAVDDFNFGAMENKSLNIFNSAYVLANPYIATDDDYFNIESIVAHEYFHNFTGDRITCKNWFQLTLKEGLTVFRDHKFSQDLHNKDIVRISEVEKLRNYQFPEDAGPLSHPIRPLSYIEMNNFYTTTVYEKGSEVIRMIESIIGEENFKKGIDIYFENFDGQAVNCEDFVWSMEKASQVSLDHFKKWYLYSGTPRLDVKTIYDESKNTYTIKLHQINLPTADQKQKEPLSLPLKFALISNNGEKLQNETTFILQKEFDEIICKNIKKEPILSINRGFSAPIILQMEQNDADLITLIKHDDDGFIKYESMQIYLKKYIKKWVDLAILGKNIDEVELKNIVSIYKDILSDYEKNPHMTSYLLRLPSLANFEDIYKTNFPLEEIYKVIEILEVEISKTYKNDFINILHNLNDIEDEFSANQIAKRSLKNKALSYLLKADDNTTIDIAKNYYYNSKSMTKRIGVLVALCNKVNKFEVAKQIYNDFYEEYKDYSNVLNKWFSLKSSCNDDNILDVIKSLMQLNTFSFQNPNKVRATIGAFAGNALQFHKLDGSGYKFLEDMIIKMDGINPSISSSLAKIFSKIKHHKKVRQQLIYKSIDNILSQKISKGLFEILSKIKQSGAN